MGIEPFLVATYGEPHLPASVRRICRIAKEELEVPQQALIDAGYTTEEARHKITTARDGTTCNKRAKADRSLRAWKSMMSSRIDPGWRFSLELKKKAIKQGMLTCDAAD